MKPVIKIIQHWLLKLTSLTAFLIIVNWSGVSQSHSLVDSFKTLLKNPPNDSLQARWNNSLFGLYLTRDVDSALVFAEEAKRIGEQIQDRRLLASNLLNYGSYYWYQSDFPKAMECYTNAAAIFEELGIETDVADARVNIATIYLILGELDKAKPYFLSAVKIYKKYNYEAGLVNSWHYIAYILESNEDYDSAIYYWNKVLVLAEKKGFISQQAWANSGLGEVYKNLGQYQKARNHQVKSLRLEELQGNDVGVLQSYIEIGSLEKELGNYTLAEQHFSKAAGMELIKTDFVSQSHLYQEYVDLYERRGEIASAYQAYKKLTAANDSIKNIENRSLIDNLNAKYESDKKENEIISLQKDKELSALILAQERNQTLVFAGASVLFLLISAGLVFGYIKIKKTSQQLDAQNKTITKFNQQLFESESALKQSNRDKDKLFALVAHDLRGPVSSLNGIGEMLDYQTKKGDQQKVEELIKQVDTVSGAVNHLLDNLLKWALSQTEQLKFDPTVFSINDLIEDSVEAFEAAAKAKNIKLKLIFGRESQIKADYNMISTVIRNLLSNSIKFTPAGGEVAIKTISDDQFVTTSVMDTGEGIPADVIDQINDHKPTNSKPGTGGEKGTGLGLALCKEFVELHSQKLNIDLSEKGTLISFQLSLA
ncbi:MAG: tetratricopeptide repeat-containing sensor histidine kinase [Cyclobacteriaceae bacterium]